MCVSEQVSNFLLDTFWGWFGFNWVIFSFSRNPDGEKIFDKFGVVFVALFGDFCALFVPTRWFG